MKLPLMGRLSCAVVAVALVMVAGCGESGPARRDVTGTVTFDGEPVAKGEILFVPADGKGPADAGPIVNGEFACEVAPGAKRVEITATREADTPAEDGLPNYVPYIPAQYNTESKLTADVKPSGENQLTFELTP